MRVQFSPALLIFLLSALLAASAQTNSRTAQAANNAHTGLPGTRDADSGAMAAPAAQFPGLPAVIKRLEAAQDINNAHMVPFTVTREYEMFSGGDQEPKGTVIAEVHFWPPATETWEIRKASGSERAEKVVKHLLEREVQYARDGNIDITGKNYDFLFAGTGEADGRPCYILQLVPNSAADNLLRGRIWIDRDTYLIHRFEGHLAKSPSWWIKELKLFRSYDDWGGIWLPTSSKGLAEVRMLGPHTMTERVVRYSATREVPQGPAAEQARIQPGGSPSHRPASAVGITIISGR